MRRLTVVEERTGALLDPVPMLVKLSHREDPLACLPGQGQLRALPDLKRGPASTQARLCQGGGAGLFERAATLSDLSLPLVRRRYSESLCRLDLRTGLG